MTWGKQDGMVVHEQDPFNAEAPPALLDGHFITPVELFYSRNHGPVPDLDPADWTLHVDGQGKTPLVLSLAELHEFESVTVTATLQCAGNRRAAMATVREIPGEDPWGPGATSTATWTGARLADVLAAAGADPDAADRHVAFDAYDVSQLAEPPQTYGSSIPLAKARGAEVLLAWEMNGEHLTPVHGAPVRVVVPGYIGARSVKWVNRITVRPTASDNYFQATAYRVLPPDADPSQAGPGDGISLGPVALNTAILRPVDGTTLAAGPVEVAGYAYAGGGRTVARVDVSADGGRSWTQADLAHRDQIWTWTPWRASFDLGQGSHALVVRAWDDTGALQPESPATLWNPKGYVNNSWDRISVEVR